MHPIGETLIQSLGFVAPGVAGALGAMDEHMDQGDVVPNWTSVCMLLMFGSVAAVGGIGGGAMVVTIFMIFDGLTPHNAIPLSKAVVFCGTVFSSLLNVLSGKLGGGKRMGKNIDADVVVMLVPGALSGTFMGVGLNRVLPGEWLVVILMLTLLVTCWMTARRVHQDLTAGPEEERQDLANPQGDGELSEAEQGAPTSRTSFVAPSPGTEHAHLDEHVGTLGALVGLLVLTVAGGVLMRVELDCLHLKNVKIDEPCESLLLRAIFGEAHDHPERGFLTKGHLSMVIAVLPGAICLLAALAVNMFIVTREGVVSEHWPREKLWAFGILGVVAGLLAGLVGVGGGLIFAPGLLFMGLPPEIVVATSTFCVLFTSSSTTMQYLFLGRVLAHLVPVYATVNIVASLIGTSTVVTLDRLKMPKYYISVAVLLAVTTSAVFSCVKLQSLVGDKKLEELPVSLLTEGMRYYTPAQTETSR